jgi:hypothetical protein
MSVDNFSTAIDSLVAPARHCFAIVPHDVSALPRLPKALYIGSGGNIVVRAVDSDQDVTFVNVASGTILDIRARHVRVSGTTAANMIGLA